jgi:CspA family cold shock protein
LAAPATLSAALLAELLIAFRREYMARGKVKWWDNKKGLGFIAQDGGQDVFVHHTAILGNGFKTLREGEEVIFDIVSSEKGPKADKVQPARAG